MSYYNDPDAYLSHWHGLDTPYKVERARRLARALEEISRNAAKAAPADRTNLDAGAGGTAVRSGPA